MSEHKILEGNCLKILKTLEEKSINTCVTSPPYWGLRDYHNEDGIGLEPTIEKYVDNLVKVFREVKRVLRDDGILWVNIADGYNNTSGYSRSSEEFHWDKRDGGSASKKAFKHPEIKVKDLMGIPWMVAFALRKDGWWLRSEIIWHKLNPFPEQVTDRPTRSHECIFLFSKAPHYYYDVDSIREPFVEDNGKYNPLGRNKRTVWTTSVGSPVVGEHIAVYPAELIEPCVIAGCPRDGWVLDPFAGSGTTGAVAKSLNRNSVLIELNPEYVKAIRQHLDQTSTFKLAQNSVF